MSLGCTEGPWKLGSLSAGGEGGDRVSELLFFLSKIISSFLLED